MAETSTGGAYLPRANYTRTGATDTGGTYASATFTGATVTSPTITSPTITSPTITGTTSIANGATLTTPVIVNPAIDTIKGNAAITGVAGGYSSDTYLAGSAILIPTSGYLAKMKYICAFDMVKTNAGTAAFTITLRIGTGGGVVGDTSIASTAFAVGTAAVDTGRFLVEVTFRTVGSGTSAVVQMASSCAHALAATGLITTGASGWGQVVATSAGFDSTIAATTIGLSVNGGASFSGTNSYVLASLSM